MARPSKAPRFQIYEDEDSGIAYGSDHNELSAVLEVDEDFPDEDEEQTLVMSTDEQKDQMSRQIADEPLYMDIECDIRRESELSATTVSTYPDSSIEIDNDQRLVAYVPPVIRPSFRRPESVRQMRMASPSPFDTQGSWPMQHPEGTTRSTRSSNAPTHRRMRRGEDEDSDESENDTDSSRHYPLVLLHVTLLPVSLPWSMEVMQEVLPAHVLENLFLLRSKVSDTIVQRGVLIPHPREEYELLEERLLEALELKAERITKCGHFRGRESTDSTITSSSSQSSCGRDSDSGIGSSGSEADLCLTCRHPIKQPASAAGEGKRKWLIRVFAANGLMRAPTWSAAWGEMESVDVEILPWIEDSEKKELDRRRDEEEDEEAKIQEDEEEKLRALVEQQVREAYEEKKRIEEINRLEREVRQLAQTDQRELSQVPPQVMDRKTASQGIATDLPPVYRTSQIPLSVLLKNYIYLLLQDRRNVAIFFLAIMAVFFALKPASAPSDLGIIQTASVYEPIADSIPLPPLMASEVEFGNDSAQLPLPVDDDHGIADGSANSSNGLLPMAVESVLDTESVLAAGETTCKTEVVEAVEELLLPPGDDFSLKHHEDDEIIEAV